MLIILCGMDVLDPVGRVVEDLTNNNPISIFDDGSFLLINIMPTLIVKVLLV